MNAKPEDLLPLKEDVPEAGAASAPWKILIADDEEAIHNVTRLALSGLAIHGRPLEFHDAYTGEQAVKIMRDQPDMAMCLMDVVMETDHAGLDAVDRIRRQLNNPFVRIVLRTGQPGQAPEREVVARYDIDDYKEKTELTAGKLFTVIHTGLSHYRRLRTLERSEAGLRKVIDATATVFQLQSLPILAEGVLQQVAALLHPESDAVMMRAAGFTAMSAGEEGLRVLAGTGPYAACTGEVATDVVGAPVRELVERALREKANQFGTHHFVGYFPSQTNDSVLYLASPSPINVDDLGLLDLFCRNISIALENRHLQREKEQAQSEMVVALSEAIEARSRETGNHVRRVAEYSRLLAELSGLDDDTAHLLYLAAPLHDAGKIAIPDAILNKPGSHTESETTIMRSHAEYGRQIFAERDSPVLKAAAIVAGEHHERWDGMGYPNGFRGEQIHIFGRITAIADVFDALTHKRCYKEAWPLRRTLQYLVEERGRRFDPELVDLFMENLDRFIDIYNRLGEHEYAAAQVH